MGGAGAPQEKPLADTFDLVFKGATVVNQDGQGLADLGVRDGCIAEIGMIGEGMAGETIDATGLHILPGVIDSQVHFREPGLEHKEHLATGSRSAIDPYWDGPVGRNNVARDNLGWRNRNGKFEGRGVAWGDNVRADPKFLDREGGNYRLSADSPALGRALRALSPPVDLDGRRRPSGSGTDLGAFER